MAGSSAPMMNESTWPETEGYQQFIEEHAEVLRKLCDIRGDRDLYSHLKTHPQLLEGSGHVRANPLTSK